MNRLSLSRHFVPLALLGLCAMGQVTDSSKTGIAENPGPPKNPEFFSAMTAIFQGGLEQYVDNKRLKGPVKEVEREELQSAAQSPTPFGATTTIKFDNLQHEIERVRETMGEKSTIVNIFHDGKLQSQTIEQSGGKHPTSQSWKRWNYDSEGRISDARAGRDKILSNHFLNYKYDPKDRLLGYEYRQGAADEPFSYTEIKYAGNTVETSTYYKSGRKEFEQIQVLDDSGRVIDLKVSDLSAGQLKLWYHAMFKYDKEGRVVEQKTDPYKSPSGGDDSAPLPGKLVVAYDDTKHSRMQEFYGPDGKLAIHTIAKIDRDGLVISLKSLVHLAKNTQRVRVS